MTLQWWHPFSAATTGQFDWLLKIETSGGGRSPDTWWLSWGSKRESLCETMSKGQTERILRSGQGGRCY